MKSVWKGFFTAREYGRIVRYGEFEYRGKSYFVKYVPFFEQALGEEPWRQHKEEQERIDRELEPEFKHDDDRLFKTVEEALDDLYRYLEGEADE